MCIDTPPLMLQTVTKGVDVGVTASGIDLAHFRGQGMLALRGFYNAGLSICLSLSLSLSSVSLSLCMHVSECVSVCVVYVHVRVRVSMRAFMDFSKSKMRCNTTRCVVKSSYFGQVYFQVAST